ncbi:SDR family oxidoreductase [Rugosimonospora africana]|uniref:Short-chain dehydrogenase/reductase n=1 Tax=Rugosimonospora africana TaxID=556532 RepID=A0A8J3VTX7_9ACTN|nr:SDR family oxidoreductase [Rugosimonospora africana]GIH18882.1 short-chain dehydrogenase/reductase [Rugosimonospora africana]
MRCVQPHAVVTGASSGIGRATVLRLAAMGYHVYAGVRRARDGESVQREAPAHRLTPLPLDVTDRQQIAAAAKTVEGHVGGLGLEALVDNAGIGLTGPLEFVPVEAFRRQFEVNVIGQLAVTQAFLHSLRTACGRIVIVGSIGSHITMPFAGPLASSKATVTSLAHAFRQELAPWGIRVVLVEPASIRTDAIDKLKRDAERVVDEFPPGTQALYRFTYPEMVRRALAQERRGSPPDVVAQVVAKALTVRRPRTRYLVGKHAYLLSAAAHLPTPVLDALRRRLFGLPRPGSQANSR